MKIGEIAQRTGVSASLIRHYERKGLLPCADRDGAGYRAYGEAELARVQFVTGARRLGCSFEEIRLLIVMQEKHHVPSSKLLELIARKLAALDDEMERLRQIQTVLSRLQTHELNLLSSEPTPSG